jgi:YD repeat-containing protein
MAQGTPPEENTPAMSDRNQPALRGSVKSCTEESTHPGMTDADGKTYPEVHLEYTTEYEVDGRILATRSRNSDGSQWVVRYGYDASGRLLKTASGVEGKALTETTYSYDQQGRLQNISHGGRCDSPVSFRYDERGRKTKIVISCSADYRPNTAVAGSPVRGCRQSTERAGRGKRDHHLRRYDRPMEVQVRDASGDLVNRALRTYDAQGHVIEEKQVLDNPETMFPSEARAKMLEQSGLSAEQLLQELRTQLTKLMAGQSGPYSVSYRYDTHGRVNHTSRRIFNHEEEIETTYNEQGDIESEITRSTRPGAETDPTPATSSLPSYSEVRYFYHYDPQGNWIEKAVSYRSTPDATFQSSTVIKRTLAYYY